MTRREDGEPVGEDLLAIADELYALPLPEFISARDAKVKELKGSDLAKPVKALAKPSLAGWVLNLLVRLETEQVEQVLEVGAALREAQAAMSGEQLRELTRQRRQVTAAVTTRARRLARDNGQRVTDAVAEQIEATLTAAMLDEQCGQALRSGMLLAAIRTTGVEEVDLNRGVALPEALGFRARAREGPARRPELHLVPDPDREAKALAAAREALQEAVTALAEANAEHEETSRDLEALQARSMQIQAEIDELRRRIAELEEAADQVDEELAEAEETEQEAADAAREAVRAHEAAAEAVARLERRSPQR